MGTAIVLLLELALSDQQMETWGWRIPFLLALPLGLVGLYLRNQMEDTPVFKELEQKDEIEGTAWTRFKDLLTNYWQPILVMFGLVIALNVANYTLLAYQPTYLKTTIGMSETTGTVVILIGELAMMACIPFFGAWSDKIGRKPMWWGSPVSYTHLTLPTM